MRKIVVTEFVSLDGVFEDPGGSEKFKYGGWTMKYGDEEFMKFKLDELHTSDALLLGRITYEGFAKAWPQRTDEAGFAEKFNRMPKFVVSKTLQKTDWNNSHIISTDFVEKIKRLEGTMVVHGSGMLARFLIEEQLVDKLTLLMYPVVLGIGKRLFADLKKTDLTLIESKPFASGIVLLQYEPKK